jgi:flagellar FliL protein
MPEHATASTAGADASAKKSLSKAKIGAVVGVIVLSQCVLAYMYLPSSKPKDGDANKEQPAAHSAPKADKEGAAGDSRADQREVDLGKFSLTAYDANSNTTLLIDFHLFGVVAADHDLQGDKGDAHEAHGHGKGGEGADDDNSTFGRLYKKCKNRFRDLVIVIIRNAQMSDLADPSLGLIKRQILAKTNSLLGEPLLKEVIFSDFAVVQQ